MNIDEKIRDILNKYAEYTHNEVTGRPYLDLAESINNIQQLIAEEVEKERKRIDIELGRLVNNDSKDNEDFNKGFTKAAKIMYEYFKDQQQGEEVKE